MKRLALAALASATLFAALPAAAQFAKSEDAIKYRKSAMFVMGQHFGRLGAMAQGKVPFDAAAAAANADVVASMSKLPFAGFGPGTDNGDTNALPEVWTDPDKFKAGAQKMQEEVAKLATAAKSGNADQLKAAFGEAGKTCKGCHDHFKKK
jgi:cytochrome c556